MKLIGPTSSDSSIREGPEGVKWELGFAYFSTGKMGFEAVGLGFRDWDWKKKLANNGNGKMSYRVYRSFETLVLTKESLRRPKNV